MWEFIVYGQLPGTSIQITFESWLIIMAIILTVAGLRKAIMRNIPRSVRVAVLGLYVAFVIRTSNPSQLRFVS